MQLFSGVLCSLLHWVAILRPLRDACVLSFLLTPHIPLLLTQRIVTTELFKNLPPTHTQCKLCKLEVKVKYSLSECLFDIIFFKI